MFLGYRACVDLNYYCNSQVSAYSSFARLGVGLGMEQQRRRMDPTTNEPLFTNCTRDFIGTLDYIFYTGKFMDYKFV